MKERSRAAVQVAGARERRAPVNSAGTWGPRGKSKDGPFRPGKTKAKRESKRGGQA